MKSCNMWNAMLILIAVWITTLLFIVTLMQNTTNNHDNLIDKVIQLEPLCGTTESFQAPPLNQEVSRRNAITGIDELWNYVSAELENLKNETKLPSVQRKIKSILENGFERKRLITRDLQRLKRSGEVVLDWKTREAQELSEIIQKRLHYYQNPEDCATAKKLVCDLRNHNFGFASHINQICHCLMLAYGSKRTLVLHSDGWIYNRQGWEKLFQPLSETCRYANMSSSARWPGTDETQVLIRPLLEDVGPLPDFMPLAIPADIAARVIRLTGNPGAWWIGQLMKYIFKLNEDISNFVEGIIQKMPFHKPIVGIHVRRTDKVGHEASFHGLEEYMFHVEEYFRLKELEDPHVEKVVYLATDEPSLLTEANDRYPEFKFVGNPKGSSLAKATQRFTDLALRYLIVDIHMLSRCEYLVCTFSSGVCRMAYELRHTLYPDISENFRSLDDIYYFSGQRTPLHKALFAHMPQKPGEMTVEVGDHIHIYGNHWNGFFKGMNNRTGEVGLYPTHKVQYTIYAADMPKHPDEG